MQKSQISGRRRAEDVARSGTKMPSAITSQVCGGRNAYQNVVPKDITLPCVSKVVFAQNAVDLNVATWMLAGVDWVFEQVPREPQYVEVAICRRTGVEY